MIHPNNSLHDVSDMSVLDLHNTFDVTKSHARSMSIHHRLIRYIFMLSAQVAASLIMVPLQFVCIINIG